MSPSTTPSTPDDGQRRDIGRSGMFTKRTLVTLSHLIERAATVEAPGEPMVVFALFQRLPYFERERQVYRQLAERADATVVAMVEDQRPDLPPGVTPVLLREDEALAREWAIVVLTPSFGAALVATDQEELAGNATTLDSGRLFHGRWGMRRDEAYAELERILGALGDRLPQAVRETVRGVQDKVRAGPRPSLELRTEASIAHLVGELDRSTEHAAELLDHAGRRGEHDPHSGLLTERFLRRWTRASASGTLPLGLLLLEVPALSEVTERFGRRASASAASGIGEVLRRQSRRVDRAVRLGEGVFLLAKPTVTEHHLLTLSGRLSQELDDLQRTFPFVPLSGKSALLVSRQRPIPIGELRGAAERLHGRRENVTVLAG